jgi:hypothetical protein
MPIGAQNFQTIAAEYTFWRLRKLTDKKYNTKAITPPSICNKWTQGDDTYIKLPETPSPLLAKVIPGMMHFIKPPN